MSTMNVYICDDHDGHWPVGVASVIVAADRDHAQQLLDEQLKVLGLKPFKLEAYKLIEIDTTRAAAYVINDGDY